VASPDGSATAKPEVAGGDGFQQLANTVRRKQVQRTHTQNRGAQIRAGFGGAPQFLQDDGHLREGGAAAAEVLGDLEPEPAASAIRLQSAPAPSMSRATVRSSACSPSVSAFMATARAAARVSLADDGALDLAATSGNRPLPGSR